MCVITMTEQAGSPDRLQFYLNQNVFQAQKEDNISKKCEILRNVNN